MGKFITREQLKESLRHYWRMRKWAKWQDGNECPNVDYMEDVINEYWYDGDCALCQEFRSHGGTECGECPLFVNGFGCTEHDSPWSKMDKSKTWTEWIENATEMARVIMKLPRQQHKYKKRKPTPGREPT